MVCGLVDGMTSWDLAWT